MPLTIRPETIADHGVIRQLITMAFGQEDEAHLVDALRHDEAYIPELALVAMDEDKIVGHILFSKIKVGDGDQVHDSLALAPVAVLPERQQEGIGGALIRTGHARAKEMGYTSVIVLGHAEYYPRFGYRPASQWNIHCPFPVPDEAFMALELVPGGLAGIQGTVQYSRPFQSV